MPYFFFPPKNVIYEVYPKIKIVFILLTLVSFQTCMSSVEQKGTYFGEKVCFFSFFILNETENEWGTILFAVDVFVFHGLA